MRGTHAVDENSYKPYPEILKGHFETQKEKQIGG
jgi:hypothetical protein